MSKPIVIDNESLLDNSISANERYKLNLKQAKSLLISYQQGDNSAVKQFEENHPLGKKSDFVPTLQDARLIVSGRSVRVKRLSLEKLKKEAKELLKNLKTKQPEAIARLTQFHPKQPQDIAELKLADAQCIIAREQGLASWAILKKHILLTREAYKHTQSPSLTLDHDLRTLHIRCGSDIQESLKVCGFSGEFMEVSNPFPEGRVPPFDPIADFIKIRNDVVKGYAVDIPPEFSARVTNAAKEFLEIDQKLRSLPQEYERIVLWFEHDPFDQLCFAYLLAHLVKCNLVNSKIELIQINRFPGINKFIGLGYLCDYPENLILIWQQRVSISSHMMAFGAQCWHAFSDDDPTELWRLSQDKSFPIMQKAMLRMLKELPWTTNGLSLTEHLALEIIDRDGPLNMARVFHFLNTESETLSFLGDIMFLRVIRRLWQSQTVLSVSHDSSKLPMLRDTVEITDIGRKLLDGQCNWLSNCGDYERWVGNVRVGGARQWYWCPEKERPVLII